MSPETAHTIMVACVFVACTGALISTSVAVWALFFRRFPAPEVPTVTDCEMCQDVDAVARWRVAAPSDDQVTEDDQITCCNDCKDAAIRTVEADEHSVGPAYVDPL